MLGLIIKKAAFAVVICGASYIKGYRDAREDYEEARRNNFMNDYETFREEIGAY